jgi:hypothetical protein
VYFSPECHAAYAALGFDPSPGSAQGVAFPDGPAYFTSRGSVMGQVSGQVVAAAFAVFNPAAVIPSVERGWTLTDAATICESRTQGAVAQLVRILGPNPDGLVTVTTLLQRACEGLRPEGKPLYAGLSSLGLPGEPMADMWRLADCLREYRGDAHTAAWTTAGFDAVEIGLLTELYWGLPTRSYIRTRAWGDEDLDRATERLEARGYMADGSLTERGRAAREEVEVSTDRQCDKLVDAIGEDLDDLLGLLGPWGVALRGSGAYPASGPHDLARTAR